MKGVILTITFLGMVFGLEKFLEASDMHLFMKLGCFAIGCGVIYTAYRFSSSQS